MRITFVNTLIELARKDPRIILMTGDLGFTVFEEFMAEFPDRFINVGIQETHMVGMGSGMALSGKIVFVYSIIPFATMRCLEFIRNDAAVHNANVKVVGVGQGYSYSIFGHTHHAVEDIGVLRSIPNLTILTPGDPQEVAAATKAMAETQGTFYMRLGKKGEPNLHKTAPEFKIGKGIEIQKGKDVVLFAINNVLDHALQAGEQLQSEGISTSVISMPTLKPIDQNLIEEKAASAKAIITIEEHNIIGGLGSAVAEILSESTYTGSFKRIGVPDEFAKTIGSQVFMRNRVGISKENIVQTAKQLLNSSISPQTENSIGVETANVKTDKKISVVVVCYKDEGNIEALYARLTNVLKNRAPDYEIIYVNDDSPDSSGEILARLAANDPRLTVVNHARNFGGQIAFSSGMAQAIGDAVVLMDGDLQDPPEIIADFIKHWQEGHQVVYGTRKEREKSMGKIKQWLYHQFYVIFSRTAYIKVPQDAGDFSLMDRVVVDHINAMPERNRFVRGLRAWVGYKSIGVPYTRPERYDGKQSVSTKGLLSAFRWARLAIFSFSYKPLEVITYTAVSATVLAGIGIIYYIISFFATDAPRGFSTLIVVMLFFVAIQLLTLGIIGEYIGRIFEEVKQRPRYIVKNIINNHKKD